MNVSVHGIALALLTLPLAAQPALENRLSAKLNPAPAQFEQVPQADQKIAIQKVAALLGKHVTFRPDGTACSITTTAAGEHQIEWQGLRINMIVSSQPVRGDAEKGISKRVQAMLIFDKCRLYDPKTNSWSDWGPRGHPLFPPVINVAWMNGHPTADGGAHLHLFKPGPMTSLAPDSFRRASDQPGPSTPPGSTPGNSGSFKPSGGGGGLPPGMQRK